MDLDLTLQRAVIIAACTTAIRVAAMLWKFQRPCEAPADLYVRLEDGPPMANLLPAYASDRLASKDLVEMWADPSWKAPELDYKRTKTIERPFSGIVARAYQV